MSKHPKLLDLTTDRHFAAHVGKIIAQLEARDENPRIYETKRTIEQQREKVRKGYSKTMASFHLKLGKDKLARAADIADAARGWNATRRFWFIIGAASNSYGVGWGGCFGLSAKQRLKLLAAFDELRAAGWPHEHPAYECRIGWDPAHLQDSPTW